MLHRTRSKEIESEGTPPSQKWKKKLKVHNFYRSGRAIKGEMCVKGGSIYKWSYNNSFFIPSFRKIFLISAIIWFILIFILVVFGVQRNNDNNGYNQHYITTYLYVCHQWQSQLSPRQCYLHLVQCYFQRNFFDLQIITLSMPCYQFNLYF